MAQIFRDEILGSTLSHTYLPMVEFSLTYEAVLSFFPVKLCIFFLVNEMISMTNRIPTYTRKKKKFFSLKQENFPCYTVSRTNVFVICNSYTSEKQELHVLGVIYSPNTL